MEKPLIGIITYRKRNTEDTPFLNTTSFSNVVASRLIKNGANTVGIMFPTGKFDESQLSFCDGFVFQGGNLIELCQIKAMEYAIKNKIPVIGICNGMQTMGGLDYLLQSNDKSDYIPEEEFLYNVDSHNKISGFHMKDLNKIKHKIILDPSSRLYKFFNTEVIYGPSLHNSAIKKDLLDKSKIFNICGISDDGVIEAIEVKDKNYFAFGVQYHIELEDSHEILFKELIHEALKYKRSKYEKKSNIN